MITTKINIKPHLAEYVIGKFGAYKEEKNKNPIFLYVQFPNKLDLYHTIWDLTEKRPENCPKDEGNVKIALPDRRIGKDPEFYNYLGYRSVEQIEKRIEVMFYAEVRAMFEENKHRLGIAFLETVHIFVCKYKIESLTSDAIIKDYYRYRKTVLGRTNTTRKYTKNELINSSD